MQELWSAAVALTSLLSSLASLSGVGVASPPNTKQILKQGFHFWLHGRMNWGKKKTHKKAKKPRGSGPMPGQINQISGPGVGVALGTGTGFLKLPRSFRYAAQVFMIPCWVTVLSPSLSSLSLKIPRLPGVLPCAPPPLLCFAFPAPGGGEIVLRLTFRLALRIRGSPLEVFHWISLEDTVKLTTS